MKEFKFCGEITEYVEIPVYVCETQKEMVKEISEIRDVLTFVDEARENLLDTAVSNEEETSVYIIYKDGSVYFKTLDEEEGKFKRYGIKAAVIETIYEYTVFGDFAVTDNGDISIEESDIEEYGVYNGQYDVKEEPEATAETVESVEETTVSETVEETAEQEETEVKTKMYWAAVRNKETNQLEVIKRDDYSSKKDFAHDLRANGYAVRFISTPDKFDEDCENYYWECEKRQNVRKCVSESKGRMEIAEQETEINAEVAEVEAEQTAEPETFSYEFNEIHKITISKRNNVYVEEFFEKMGGSYVKLGEKTWGCIEDIEEYYGIKINRNVQTNTEEMKPEIKPTAENITVSGTNQDNINVLIAADIANTFEMITHTGYFDTS